MEGEGDDRSGITLPAGQFQLMLDAANAAPNGNSINQCIIQLHYSLIFLNSFSQSALGDVQCRTTGYYLGCTELSSHCNHCSVLSCSSKIYTVVKYNTCICTCT